MEVDGWFVAEFNCCYWTDSEKADVALYIHCYIQTFICLYVVLENLLDNNNNIKQTNKQKIYKESSVCYIMSAYVSKINIQLFYYNK